jgi:hypothetical protein
MLWNWKFSRVSKRFLENSGLSLVFLSRNCSTLINFVNFLRKLSSLSEKWCLRCNVKIKLQLCAEKWSIWVVFGSFWCRNGIIIVWKRSLGYTLNSFWSFPLAISSFCKILEILQHYLSFYYHVIFWSIFSYRWIECLFGPLYFAISVHYFAKYQLFWIITEYFALHRQYYFDHPKAYFER